MGADKAYTAFYDAERQAFGHWAHVHSLAQWVRHNGAQLTALYPTPTTPRGKCLVGVYETETGDLVGVARPDDRPGYVLHLGDHDPEGPPQCPPSLC